MGTTSAHVRRGMQDLDMWVNVTVRKNLLCLLVCLEHIVVKHVSTTTTTTTTTTSFICMTVNIYSDAKAFSVN